MLDAFTDSAELEHAFEGGEYDLHGWMQNASYLGVNGLC